MTTLRDRVESGFAAWGHFCYRHAWLILTLSLLSAAALCSQVYRVEIDTSTEGFLEEDDPIRLRYDAFRSQFGRDEKILLAVVSPKIFDARFLKKLEALHREIEANVPKLESVTSLLNARSTRGEDDELIVEDLLESWPEDARALDLLEQRALSNAFYRDLLIAADGSLTSIVIETDTYSSAGLQHDELTGFDQPGANGQPPDTRPPFLTGAENREIVTALDQIIARHRARGFEIHMAGSPAMMVHLQRAMETDLLRFTGLSILAIGLFLGLLFRRLVSICLPLLVSFLAMLSTLGAMAIFDISINLPTQIMPSLLIAIGVGNSVHIFAIFFQARRRGDDKQQALAFALGHSGLAILMTNLTTAGGLLSFVAAEIGPVADFGIVAPLGVMNAFAFTMLLLPPLIAIFPSGETVRGGESSTDMVLSQRIVVAMGDFGVDHAGAIVASSALLFAIAVLGGMQIAFAHSPLEWFPEESPFRMANAVLDEKLGGTMFIEVLVDSGEENGLHDPALLRRMDELRRFANRLQVGDVVVGKSVSILDVLKEIHQALNENRREFYDIPSERDLIAQELLLFENSGADDLEDLVDSQFSRARITMQLPFVDSVQYEPYLDRLEEGISEILSGRADFTTTGLMAVMARIFNAVMRSMAKTYALALLIITPMMIVLIGRLGMGLISMIPNVVPIVFTLGIMGWAGIPLDAFTLLVGSIALGLAVDDTIHFMHNFRRYHEQTGDVRNAVQQTMAGTGQALFFTSLVLSSGFFIFMLASMENLFYFGLLTGITLILAFLADALLAPALMVLMLDRGQR